MAKIKHGFSGQRLIVYPFYIIEQALNNPLVADLVVHSMGYFPKAENHYIDRASGCGEYLFNLLHERGRVVRVGWKTICRTRESFFSSSRQRSPINMVRVSMILGIFIGHILKGKRRSISAINCKG